MTVGKSSIIPRRTDIENPQPSLGVGGKLLAQSELDQGLLVPASEEGRNAAEEENHEFE